MSPPCFVAVKRAKTVGPRRGKRTLYTPQTWKLVFRRYHTYSDISLWQLQVGPNFFQAPTPPYHSTSLTWILTRYHGIEPHTQWIVQLWLTIDPPNMETSIRAIPYLYLYIYDNCKWVQTSFKRQLLLITPLHWLEFWLDIEPCT
jgi:hypothetical protein